MKIPEKAPKWTDLIKKSGVMSNASKIVSSAPVIAKANKEYVYWDKFKYYDFPSGLNPEEAWALLKLERIGSGKLLPLKDIKKRPFRYCVLNSMVEYLHNIDRKASGNLLIEGMNALQEEKDTIIIYSLMEEAITSSILEGAVTTRRDAKEMLRTARKPKDRHERMVLNNYQTMVRIKEHLSEPLTPELIRYLHKGMTEETLEKKEEEGVFRTPKDDGVLHVYYKDQTILHTPPPASMIADYIEAMCKFANEDDPEDFVHPVIKGIILHFWLAYVHPFVDGNGRTARALFYWYMLKKGYWPFEYLSISSVILKAPVKYYKAFLYTEHDDNDMNYFIMFHLEAIRKSLDEVGEYVKRRLSERRRIASIKAKYSDLNIRQQAILSRALREPETVFTFTSHGRSHGIVYETARTDILELARLGLLVKSKLGRAFVFKAAPDIGEKLR